MQTESQWKFPAKLFFSELIGTAMLLMVGLSLVIFIFGTGSPMAQVLPNENWRRGLCGFLFGGIGALIALSPVGKVSGAHINPIVSLGFWLFHKIDFRMATVYISAQLIGAVVGCLPLLAWGPMGQSVSYGATIPGSGYGLRTVFFGEVVTTFTMIVLLCSFLAFRKLRPFTPALFPFLYSVMVVLEGPISGTSTNPARSFGPAIISGVWQQWWIYWIGPLVGMFLAGLCCSFLLKRIQIAKLYYFNSDSDHLFRRMAGS